MRVELVDNPTRWKEIAAPWENLCDSAADPNPFVRHAWLSAWQQAFAPHETLSALIVWRGGKLTCALPFLRNDRHWRSPFNHFAARTDPPVHKDHLDDVDAVLHELVAHKKRWSQFSLPEISKPSAAARALFAGPAGLGVFGTVTLQSPYLQTTGDYDEHLARCFSSKTRASLRRKKRQAEKQGFDFLHLQDEAAIEKRWASTLEAEHASWKGDGGSSMLAAPGAADFVHSITLEACGRKKAHLFTVEREQEVAAFLLGYVEGGTFFFHKTGFRREHAKASPGRLILFESLRHAFSDPEIGIYDFLGAADPYKTEHTDAQRTHVSLHLSHRGRRSTVHHLARRAKHLINGQRKNRQQFELAVDRRAGRG